MKNQMKMIQRFLVMTLVLTMGGSVFMVPAFARTEEKSFGLSYQEITDRIDNPDRGFYDHYPLNHASSSELYSVKIPQTANGSAVHLRVNLGPFSYNYRAYSSAMSVPSGMKSGDALPISDNFMSSLRGTLDNIRSHGDTVIIRFAYDGFKGVSDLEPDMDGIVSHIHQLAPIFTEYQDIISAVESGFLGRWGEQHTSKIARVADNYWILVNELLLVVPEPITVSVRTLDHLAEAMGITKSQLLSLEIAEDSPYYRLGMYNDGYLASYSDYGTFDNREAEISWLEKQTARTLYGGETCIDSSYSGYDYSSIANISSEMFRTHTSYLNIDYDTKVINKWRNGSYTGNDPVYRGLSGFTYIENHMGYRFVLRSSSYMEEGDKLRLKWSVENVGAGNVLKPYSVSLISAAPDGSSVEYPLSYDVRSIKSQTTGQMEAVIAKPAGGSKLYLKITATNGADVRLANNNAFCAFGNLIGVYPAEAEEIPEETEKEENPVEETAIRVDSFAALKSAVAEVEGKQEKIIITSDLTFTSSIQVKGNITLMAEKPVTLELGSHRFEICAGESLGLKGPITLHQLESGSANPITMRADSSFSMDGSKLISEATGTIYLINMSASNGNISLKNAMIRGMSATGRNIYCVDNTTNISVTDCKIIAAKYALYRGIYSLYGNTEISGDIYKSSVISDYRNSLPEESTEEESSAAETETPAETESESPVETEVSTEESTLESESEAIEISGTEIASYEEFKAALDANGVGESVTLVLCDGFTLSKNVKVNGNVTILSKKPSTIDLSLYRIEVLDNACLTLGKGVKFYQPANGNQNPVVLRNRSGLIMEGAKISSDASGIYVVNANKSDAYIRMKDSLITASDASCRTVYAANTAFDVSMAGSKVENSAGGYAAYRGSYAMDEASSIVGKSYKLILK